MSKVTVVTNQKGDIIVIGQGHLSEKTARTSGSQAVQSGLRAGPDQRLSELDLAEDVSHLKNWSELHAKVRPHVKHTA